MHCVQFKIVNFSKFLRRGKGGGNVNRDNAHVSVTEIEEILILL